MEDKEHEQDHGHQHGHDEGHEHGHEHDDQHNDDAHSHDCGGIEEHKDTASIIKHLTFEKTKADAELKQEEAILQEELGEEAHGSHDSQNDGSHHS